MLATLSGGALAAGGANAINMVVDRDIDKLMHRTRNRPLVTGAMTPRNALVFAVTLEVVAFAELWAWVNLLSAVLAVSATLFYVFVYTLWLKRTSSQNIVIGGAAGAVPVLVGWAAVTDSLAWTPVVLFAIIFVWTPPHFWALAFKYKDDYKAADVPMLPAVATFRRTAREIIVYSVLLVAVSLVLAAVAHLGAVYMVSAVVLGVVFVALALRLWLRGHAQGGHAAVQLLDHLPHAAVRDHGGRHPHQALIEMAPETGTAVDPESAGPAVATPEPDGTGPPGVGVAPQTANRPAPRRRRALAIGTVIAIGLAIFLFFGLAVQSGFGRPGSGRVVPIGSRAPGFTLPSLTGGAPVDLDALGRDAHRPVVLNFFASWCTPCQKETPLLAKTADAERAKGLGGPVHRRGRGRSAVRRHTLRPPHRHHLPGGNDADLRVTCALYGLNGEPNTFFIDADGRVIGHVIGAVNPGTAVCELGGCQPAWPDPPGCAPTHSHGRAAPGGPSRSEAPLTPSGSERRPEARPRAQSDEHDPVVNRHSGARPESMRGERRPGRRREEPWTRRPASRAVCRAG